MKTKNKVIIGILLFGCIFLCMIALYSFLSPTSPIHGEILVIESWIEYAALKQAAKLFKSNDYSYIIAVGGPGNEDVDWQTKSDSYRVAFALENLGISSDAIIAVPCLFSKKDRTLLTALTLKQWLQEHKPEITSMDIFTVTVHARKSHILFSRVFEPGIKTGIISAKTTQYNQNLWFFSGTGLYVFFRNLAGVFYALVVNIDDVEDYTAN